MARQGGGMVHWSSRWAQLRVGLGGRSELQVTLPPRGHILLHLFLARE